jgi:prepilin-type N-terminal cleavage/methylation domain-containing protein
MSHRTVRQAFTITELLVVVAIIAIVLTLGVEGWRAMVGHSSAEGASNQISAFVGRAREDAKAMRTPRGVLLFENTRGEVIMAMVHHDDPSGRPTQVEMVPESEVQVLRSGVGALFIGSSTPRYSLPGLLLFDGHGQLLVRDFSIRKDGKLGGGKEADPEKKLMGLQDDYYGPVTHLGVTLFRRGDWEGQPKDKRDEWLDKKGKQLFVNRYSGTLLDGGR